jgi:ParB family chromosome partitioning protein
LTLEQLAAKVGKSVSYVAKRLVYTNLIEPVRKLFYDMKIGPQQALLVARLGPDQQKQTLAWLKDGYGLDDLYREIQRNFFLILKDAPFDTADADLVPKAGSCLACPKRTGFDKALFDDVKNEDTCTDPGCFDNKCEAFVKRQIAAHKDALRLSVVNSYDNPAKLKGTKIWVKAGDKNCPDTTMGLVVEILGRNPIDAQRGVRLGQTLKVCDKPGCKTHAAAKEASTRVSSRSDSDRATDKKRKLELRRRGLIFKELAADKFEVKEKDYRQILDWAIRGLSSDDARAVCNAMGWEIAAAKYGGKDYTGTIEKNLAKLTPEAVENWLYLIMLAGTDLWFYNNTKVEKPELLEAKAKASGVPLDELAKKAKEKPAKKSKPEATTKKVEKK